MAKLPVRFKKVAAAFHDEVARAAAQPCESSGDSEHLPEKDGSSRDLFDLVASFVEKGGFMLPADNLGDFDSLERTESDSSCYCLDIFDRLRNLLGFDPDSSDDDDDDDIGEGRRKIQSEVEDALKIIGGDGSEKQGFNRQLMAFLRDRGFDAGLCKSKWEKTSKFPAGDYQYMDVKFGDGARYIVELCLAGNFQIARPSSHYTALLELFPRVFVGTPEELKQVVRLMCNAIKESMKSTDLFLPPWRRNGYMQAKWFGSYKRTTAAITKTPVLERKSSAAVTAAGKVGAICGRQARLPEIHYQCRDDFATKNGLRVGYLTATFTGN